MAEDDPTWRRLLPRRWACSRCRRLAGRVADRPAYEAWRKPQPFADGRVAVQRRRAPRASRRRSSDDRTSTSFTSPAADVDVVTATDVAGAARGRERQLAQAPRSLILVALGSARAQRIGTRRARSTSSARARRRRPRRRARREATRARRYRHGEPRARRRSTTGAPDFYGAGTSRHVPLVVVVGLKRPRRRTVSRVRSRDAGRRPRDGALRPRSLPSTDRLRGRHAHARRGGGRASACSARAERGLRGPRAPARVLRATRLHPPLDRYPSYGVNPRTARGM